MSALDMSQYEIKTEPSNVDFQERIAESFNQNAELP